MNIRYVLPASIECDKARLIARKIIPQQPIKNSNPKLKALILFPYKLDFNGEAHIVEELHPKEYKIAPASMLTKGDGIKGDMIYSLLAYPIKGGTVKPTTGRHKATHIDTKDFTYAKLEKPFRSIENMPKMQLLSYIT